MDNFWSLWIAAWVPFIASLVGLIWAVPRNATVDFLEQSGIERILVRAVTLAYRPITNCFGPRLFSVRAFAASVALSIVWLCVTFIIAGATTPHLWQDAGRMMHPQVHFPSELGQYQSAAHITTFAATMMSLVAEFVYIAKSRLIIRRLRLDSSYWALFALVLSDVVTTFVLFCLINPIIIIASLYILHAIYSGVDLSLVTVLRLFPGDISRGDAGRIIAEIDVWNALQAYILFAWIMLRSVWDHVRSFFTLYESFNFFPVTFLQGSEQLLPKGVNFPTVIASGFTMPFTTLLATAFATTAWIVYASTLLVASRFICHVFVSARSIFGRIHNHPGLLFWLGVVPAIIIFIGGGVAPESALDIEVESVPLKETDDEAQSIH